MSRVTITKTFTDSNGNPYDPTSVVFESPDASWGVKRDDTNAAMVAAGVSLSSSAVGTWTYTFDEPDGADGLGYTYWIKYVVSGHTDYDKGVAHGSVSDDLAVQRNTDKYLTWIKAEFAPLVLITPDATLKQCLENAIRYWNTHSAYRVSTMVSYISGQKRAQLPPEFKQVAQVYPSRSTSWIWNNHPMWSLLGITVLDNYTTDMILLSEAFRNYRIYVGTNFRWTFEPPKDQSEGGYLYCVNLPSGTTGVYVLGTRRITKSEDIRDEYINDWLLRYFKALVKQVEGNTLRKANMILPGGVDGQSLVDEGLTEMEKLQEDLAINGRWIAFCRRQ